MPDNGAPLKITSARREDRWQKALALLIKDSSATPLR